jgi:hypothetical protein
MFKTSLAILALSIAVICVGCGSKTSSKPSSKKDSPITGTGPSGRITEKDAESLSDDQIKKVEEQTFSKEPPPVQILVGNTTGYHVNKPTVIVAKTAKEFSAMKKMHFSHGVKKEPTAPVDLKTRQVVGLFMPKNRPGTEAVVTDVHEEGDTIVVSGIKLLPGENCKYSGPKTRPFHFVETRKMKATKIRVKVETQKSSPCMH